MSLAPIITDVCRVYFGHHAIRAGKKQLVDNRCGQCPLRELCVTWGGKSAHTTEQLQANNDEFAREAVIVLGQVQP